MYTYRLRKQALDLYKRQLEALDLVVMMMREKEKKEMEAIQSLKKQIKEAEDLLETAARRIFLDTFPGKSLIRPLKRVGRVIARRFPEKPIM
jgi:hypothetical protein